MNEPDLDFDLVGVTQVLEIPGLKSILQNTIMKILSSILLFPNFYYFKLIEDQAIAAEVATFEPDVILILTY